MKTLEQVAPLLGWVHRDVPNTYRNTIRLDLMLSVIGLFYLRSLIVAHSILVYVILVYRSHQTP